MTSIASTLGIGSGLDTKALIDQLATASRAPRETALKARETANTAKVSALASVGNSLSTFSSALGTLIGGGTLSTQPTVSDATLLTAKAQPGARIGGLSAQLEITRLASAQTLVSGQVATADTTPIGQGSFTLTTAAGAKTITIDATNDSLSGLARAINAAGAGVTASIVTDGSGARLLLKGETGAANAFTLTADSGADPGLSAFTWDGSAGGMTRPVQAQDAALLLDGVPVTRATNSIADLVPGVTLDLKGAKPGTQISLGATRPAAALTQAVTDVVDAYNELFAILKEQTAANTGTLRNEGAIRDMKRQLSQLTATVVNSGGGPATLAEIGISTNRDGTLTLDKTKLQAVIASDPDGVEAMFNPGQYSSSPLLTITSPMGRAKPGTYLVADLLPQTSGASASGTIAGVAAVTTGDTLVASIGSKASGLVIRPLGAVVRATITVDQGIAGALAAIKDALLASGGPITVAQDRSSTEAKAITADRARMEANDASYRARLTRSFTAMDSRVTAYKATQSYLEQQVKVWTNEKA